MLRTREDVSVQALGPAPEEETKSAGIRFEGLTMLLVNVLTMTCTVAGTPSFKGQNNRYFCNYVSKNN